MTEQMNSSSQSSRSTCFLRISIPSTSGCVFAVLIHPPPALTIFRKRAVSSQSAELEALQARLRATEERLKARQSQSASPSGGNSKQSIPRRRVPVGNPSGSLRTTQPAAPTSPLATQPAANQSRPQTASSASHQPSSNKGNTSKEQLEETQSEEEESS